ncbi:GNAT family N-acetyltransferase [Nocardioides sp.]|uniref:GNAT family N-acetyltransferase n=1 Tax=Nocardioides sp. TaxID=35761 RepID=UPI0035299B0E
MASRARPDRRRVAELDGTVAAMGFLEIVDGTGQPGMPTGTDGLIGYIVHPEFTGRGVASDLALGLLAARSIISGFAGWWPGAMPTTSPRCACWRRPV